ncbi:MAG TPA: hypothetical protein VGR89_11935 [Puia sp.]|nr:hypothetical protein [Puia sp.]
MCRWVTVLLVGIYVFLLIGLLIALAMLFGIRLPNGIRWALVFAFTICCLGKVWLSESLLPMLRPRFRPPILPEEQRLGEALQEVLAGVRFLLPTRVLIDGDPTGCNRSAGYRTIIIHSGALLWASDGELRGIMAYELWHLRNGMRVSAEVFRTASPIAPGFRKLRRLVTKGFRLSWLPGLMLVALACFVMAVFSPIYAFERLFGLANWAISRWQVREADAWVFGLGYGDAWRAWLEKSALGENARRIRRLEKMANLR